MAVALPAPTPPSARPAFDWGKLVRPAIGLVLLVAAYRVSLVTLFESMRLDTPLAHLALVPLIAAAIAYASRRSDAGPNIHDRQLDWIIGLTFMLIAAAANVVLPARLSSQFWVWRVDLLTMPLFVAGLVALLFGTRTLWKYRLAVLFLFLAWPYPYSLVLDRWLGEFTNTTIWALDQVLGHIPLATKVAGSSSLFEVMHNGLGVQMSVASACSGANGLVGFLLVGGAFMLVLDGSKPRKIAWLAMGAVLVWLLNLARIMIIFWSAQQYGEKVAIDGFHPYVGLVVFNIAILVMVLLLKPFGLSLPRGEAGAGPLAAITHRPKPWTALACVSVLAVGIGVYNGQLRDYDRIANSLGAPRLANFETSQETPDGWQLNKVATYDWSKRFFGDQSTWNRYSFLYTGTGDEALRANIPITVDIIETPDRAALSAYGVEQCYTFHGYSITGRQSVDLGNGLIGGMLTWTSSETNLSWTTLYWHWPITTADGTEYERVTLVMNDQPTNQFTAPDVDTDAARQLQLDLNDVLRGAGSAEDRERLVETREFMIGFAREMVAERQAAPDTQV
jgi:exosortase/archaeosortase family protein